MNNIQHWCKKQIVWFNKQIRPIESENLKYFGLIETIRKGELFTKEELAFAKTLSKEKIMIMLELSNIQYYNLKTRDDDP